jgi:ATP-binding cassette subfamily F protein 3
LIQLSELTKSFGDRVLFDHVTWQITDRERVGLCGPNGAGKTTLLKMMAGLDEPDEAASAFGDLLAMKHEMHALEERLGDESIPEAEHEAMLHRYSDLQDRFRVHDGYSIELKTATVLQGLGFKTTDFERPTETFSGGWQMRIALAKLLLGQPNLLLLDEPTNHLDLTTIEWLERELEARRAELKQPELRSCAAGATAPGRLARPRRTSTRRWTTSRGVEEHGGTGRR